jgi:hypothetical protein
MKARWMRRGEVVLQEFWTLRNLCGPRIGHQYASFSTRRERHLTTRGESPRKARRATL